MKRKSNNKTQPEQSYSRADLDARFSSIQWIVWLSMVAIGLLFFFGSNTAFTWLNRDMAAADGPSEIRLWPQSAWFIFSLFGALALSWEMTLQLWSIFGDRREADLFGYWSGLGVTFRYSGGPADYNVRKILRWMGLLIVLPIGILSTLALPIHTSLRETDIRDCGYAFSSCKTYPYATAQRMTVIQGFRTRDGKLTKRAGIVIDFRDGRRWSSANIGDFRATVDPNLADFLQRKTGLAYNYVETQDDIPLLNVEIQSNPK